MGWVDYLPWNLPSLLAPGISSIFIWDRGIIGFHWVSFETRTLSSRDQPWDQISLFNCMLSTVSDSGIALPKLCQGETGSEFFRPYLWDKVFYFPFKTDILTDLHILNDLSVCSSAFSWRRWFYTVCFYNVELLRYLEQQFGQVAKKCYWERKILLTWKILITVSCKLPFQDRWMLYLSSLPVSTSRGCILGACTLCSADLKNDLSFPLLLRREVSKPPAHLLIFPVSPSPSCPRNPKLCSLPSCWIESSGKPSST